MKRWDPSVGHESRPTRVFTEDIENNQDKFLVYMNPAELLTLMNRINPKKDKCDIGTVINRSGFWR